MSFLVDCLALLTLLAFSAVFAVVLMDELDPAWNATAMPVRLRLLRWIGGTLLLLWLLALAGWMGLPGSLVRLLSGSIWSGVTVIAAILGLVVLLGGMLLLARQALAVRSATLRGHVIACQIPYAALLVGVGCLQAALGSN